MKDFSEKYRGVTHFGLALEERADMRGKMDAWRVLKDALQRTVEEDVRSELLYDALDYLENQGCHERAIKDFRNALLIGPPVARYMTIKFAMQRIWKGL
ncbi:MAG: hypothetical protein DI551_10615 [Micavibrio aeruginosavorus]|uniref:Uncharacterized protein n=1 Tax=Micavibrio aeruginosavorus TaxID=349221 RepID=A0A2W5MVF4_9BACT|nr:MAG: hypothetical protein DI551_10615 [Micavibrio aeruginosavorus]